MGVRIMIRTILEILAAVPNPDREVFEILVSTPEDEVLTQLDVLFKEIDETGKNMNLAKKSCVITTENYKEFYSAHKGFVDHKHLYVNNVLDDQLSWDDDKLDSFTEATATYYYVKTTLKRIIWMHNIFILFSYVWNDDTNSFTSLF